MNDEIKEINLSEMLFNRDERLLDYITNLQEQNEKLKDQKKKAIKYIKKVSCNNNIYFYTEDTDDVLGDISKILGGDEE